MVVLLAKFWHNLPAARELPGNNHKSPEERPKIFILLYIVVLPILLIQDTYISYINKFGHVYTKSIKKKGIQKLNHKETTWEYKNGLGLCTCDTHIHIHTMNVWTEPFLVLFICMIMVCTWTVVCGFVKSYHSLVT